MIIYPNEINSQYGPLLYFGSILRNELKVLFPGFVSKNFCSFEKAFLVYLITIKQPEKTTRQCDTSPCQWLRESSSIFSDFAC